MYAACPRLILLQDSIRSQRHSIIPRGCCGSKLPLRAAMAPVYALFSCSKKSLASSAAGIAPVLSANKWLISVGLDCESRQSLKD